MPRRKNKTKSTPSTFLGPLPRNARRRKPRQKKNTKPKGRSMASTSIAKSAFHRAVCANTDPFCMHAANAKLYDGNTQRSLTFASKDIYSISTLATGDAMVIVTSNPQKAVANMATETAGTVLTWSGGYTVNSFYSQYNSTGGSWRVVSYGVRVFTTQAWTAATGTIILTETGSTDVSLTVGQLVSSSNLGNTSKAFALRDANLTFIGRPSGVAAQLYNPNFTTNDFNDWTTLLIGITGASASTAVVSFELTVNYEWLPRNNSGLATVATKAAPHLQTVMETRDNAFSMMDTINSVKDFAETSFAVLKTIEKAGEAVVAIGESPYARAAAGLVLM